MTAIEWTDKTWNPTTGGEKTTMPADQPYQLLPPLTVEEYAALREDIAAAGIRVPIDVDEAGTILNGHHRKAITDELGIDCPSRVVSGLTAEEKRHHALAVNLQGRHLTREQRRDLIAAELEHDPSRSDRAIARLVGVDHKTVGAVRRELAGGEIPHYEPPFGRLGPYKVHPFLDEFSWLSDERFAEIVDSIKRNGLRYPIVLNHDRTVLIDGRIRYLACEAANVDVVYETLGPHYTEEQIINFIYDVNVVRRHLTADQRAIIVVELEALRRSRSVA